MRDATKNLPAIDLTTALAFSEGSFVFPNPWQRAICRCRENGLAVCRLSFGVSPIRDRIYVDGVEVAQAHRRQGYGTALLLEVAKFCSPQRPLLPITALNEVWASNEFWNALRDSKGHGLTVTRDVRVGEMEVESARWCRLIPLD